MGKRKGVEERKEERRERELKRGCRLRRERVRKFEECFGKKSEEGEKMEERWKGLKKRVDEILE